MPSCIILGANSDIAKEITARMVVDGWTVHPWTRHDEIPQCEWDAVVCAMGSLNPIGPFFKTSPLDWEENMRDNALHPLFILHDLWPQRRPGAAVCFFSGAGVSRPAPTYSAYSASKIMLMKMTEILDDENPDEKFFIIGPGMVRTKIQQQTLAAGPERAENYERVKQFMESGDWAHGKGTSHDRIYACLKWCLQAPKDVVGGRNFYAPGIDWGHDIEPLLRANRDMFRLRRFGGGL